MRYLISIMYDGSKFYGFQRQKDKNSVQKKIEEALTIINKKKVEIKGAGRTDRKVHALDQKASFDLEIQISCSNLQKALNSLVKPYIYITNVKMVNDDFHARFNVLKKEYIYKINMGKYDPLQIDYELQLNRKLNIKKMQECAKYFIGVHSFQNFVAGNRISYECIIYSIKFKKNKNHLIIKFAGKSFYRYMVRNLVGAMLDVALEIRNIEEIKDAINNPQYKKQFSTALPEGLYLSKIEY